MLERTNLNHDARKNLFKNALMYGRSPEHIKDEKLRNYLKSKPKCKVKLYQGYVFIYSKNSHQLYTMYELPEEYREEVK